MKLLATGVATALFCALPSPMAVNAQVRPVPPIQVPNIPTPAQPAAPRPQVPQSVSPAPRLQLATTAEASGGNAAYEATLAGITGTNAHVQFDDGTTKTLAIDAATQVSLKSQIGKPIAFRVVNGALQVASDARWATLDSVNNGQATLRDASNKTVTYSVDSTTAAKLQADIGKQIAYVVNGDAALLVSSEPPG